MSMLSRREFYLLLFSPVLFVFVICSLVFGTAQTSVTRLEQANTAQRRSIDAARQSIVAARKAPVPRISAAKLELSLLTEQVETEKRLAEISAHPGSMVPARWTSVTGRIEAVHAIESTFEDNGLIIVSRQADADAKNVVPRELSDFSTAARKDGNHPIPEVWRFHVIGTYNDVLASLDELGRRDAFLVPLAVEMKMLAGDATRRIWSLWIWV